MNNDLKNIINMMKSTWDARPTLIFVKDTNRKFQYINKAYYEDTGLKPEEIIGKTGQEVFKANITSGEVFIDTDYNVINNGAVEKYENSFRYHDKDYFYETTKSPIYNDKKEIVGIYCTSRNIGKRVNITKKFNQNLNLQRVLIDTIPYPIFIKSVSGEYLLVNRYFANNIGKSIEEIIGKTDFDIFDQELAELFHQKDLEVIEKQKGIMYLRTGLRPEKKFMTIKEPLFENGSVVSIVGIVNRFIEITDLQENLIREQKSNAINRLAGGIAHDLNNILTSIMGISNYMMITDVHSDEERDKLIEIIYKGSVDAASLIKKLLTFAQLKSGEKSTFDIHEIIDRILGLVSSNKSKGIEFIKSFNAEFSDIKGDQTQITQMILNLILNGIDAIESNQGIIDIQTHNIELKANTLDHCFVVSDTLESGKFILINIGDNGKGINRYNLHKIFDPFYSTKETGSGLGLSVVYGVISSHSGAIDVSTKINEGTIFSVFLPIDN